MTSQQKEELESAFVALDGIAQAMPKDYAGMKSDTYAFLAGYLVHDIPFAIVYDAVDVWTKKQLQTK